MPDHPDAIDAAVARAEAAHQPEAVPESPPPARIVITFLAPGSADATVSLDRVSPGQLYGAAWLLDSIAHEARGQQVATDAGSRLVIPAPPNGALARRLRS